MSPLWLVFTLLVLKDAVCVRATAAGGRRGGRGGGGGTHWQAQKEEKEDKAPFCYPYNYTCGPIAPTPPRSYEAHLEHVDMVGRSTHYLEEFYDYEENMLAVTDSSGTTFLHTIFLYELNTVVFMLTEREGEGNVTKAGQPIRTTCAVEEISHSTMFHPFPGTNGTTHMILAPSQALLFGNEYRYSYIKVRPVRGLECNEWDACINDALGSFHVQYYWSDPSRVFDMFGYTSERPVTMHVKGHVRTPSSGNTETDKELDSMYSVSLFDATPDLDKIRWAFEIPSGVYCKGFPSVKKPPQSIAKETSMRTEVTLQLPGESRQEYVSTVLGWFDYYGKRSRTDSIPNPATVEYAAAGLVEVATIRDFHAQVEYVIDKTLGNCTTLPINGEGFDTITLPNGDYTIKNPLFMFGLGENANLTYHGTKYARGLPCDVWVGHMDLELENDTIQEAFLYELYFLQNGWSEDSGNQQKIFAVPVLVSLHQDFSNNQYLPEDVFINLYQNIYKYEQEQPSSSVYDITPCFFGHDHIRRFQIAFSSTFRHVFDDNPELFTAEVEAGITGTLEIPGIRLQHTQIEYDEVYDRLFCEFTLVDQPQVDMDLPAYVGKPLAEVVERLQNYYTKIFVVISEPNMPPTLMTPLNDSLRELFEDGCYSRKTLFPLHDLDNTQPDSDAMPLSPYESEKEGEIGDNEGFSPPLAFMAGKQSWLRSNDEKKYSPGAMAGMAMGMLALGLLLGTVVTLVILQKMGLSNDIEFIPLSSRRQ